MMIANGKTRASRSLLALHSKPLLKCLKSLFNLKGDFFMPFILAVLHAMALILTTTKYCFTFAVDFKERLDCRT